MIRSVDYFEAWSLWFSGELTQQYVLWGLQILWWGRIGKVISFLSGVTIVLEIIGAKRVREFGNSLHKPVNFQSLFKSITEFPKFIRLTLRYYAYEYVTEFIFNSRNASDMIKREESATEKELFDRWPGRMIFVILVHLSLVIVLTLSLSPLLFDAVSSSLPLLYQLLGYSLAVANVPLWLVQLVIGIILLVFFPPLSAIVATLIIIIVMIAMLILDGGFIEPIAWVLERPSLEKLAKITSVILLVIGVHFDLLGG